MFLYPWGIQPKVIKGYIRVINGYNRIFLYSWDKAKIVIKVIGIIPITSITFFKNPISFFIYNPYSDFLIISIPNYK